MQASDRFPRRTGASGGFQSGLSRPTESGRWILSEEPGIRRASEASGGIRGRASPEVSVVVASSQPRPLLDYYLRALLPQCARYGAEIVVARTPTNATEQADLETAYPTVRFVPVSGPTTVRQLRAEGMQKARGDIVAFTDDRRVPTTDWLPHLLRSTPEFDAGLEV